MVAVRMDERVNEESILVRDGHRYSMILRIGMEEKRAEMVGKAMISWWCSRFPGGKELLSEHRTARIPISSLF